MCIFTERSNMKKNQNFMMDFGTLALYQEYLVTDVITVDYRTVNQENGVSHTAFANFNKNGVFASGFTVYSYLGNNIVIKPANGVVQATTLPNIQRLAYEQVYARIKN